MVSSRESVRFPGRLQGEGRQAECTVQATKVGLPGTGVFAYTNYSISDVSKALPPGTYELVANGERIAVRHFNGHWLAAPAV